jgi:SAM-dependent methyltransferase
MRLAAEQTDKPGSHVARLQALAKKLRAHASSDLARDWLDASGSLPWIQPRRLYQYPAKKDLFPRSAVMKLPAEHRALLLSREFDERAYYDGRYGNGLAYWPLIEALARNGVSSLAALRVLDIGYGTILPLRLMACLGARTLGIDTDTFPIAIYGEPADTGPIRAVKAKTNPSAVAGSIDLLRGRVGADWTPEPESLDLIVSRNTLKNGYVHPSADYAHEPNVRLELDDRAFVRIVRESLRRGGLFVLYNTFDPAEPGPGADGRSPFSREDFTNAGFEVLAHDQPDDAQQAIFADVMRAAGETQVTQIPRALGTIVRAA